MDFQIGSISVQGPRSRNEDRGLALHGTLAGHPFALLGVCDGLGGSNSGDRAAAEVAVALGGFLAYLPPSLIDSSGNTRNYLIQRAIEGFHEAVLARLDVLAKGLSQPSMATTLAACFIWEEALVVWWLGDSRVYRFRNGRLERLTQDHSLVERDLHLSEEQALEHPARSQITRFIRAGVNWTPEIYFGDCQDGDVFLVVSDGISASCRTWELEAVLVYYLTSRISPELLASSVINHLSGNLNDNATISVAFCGTPKPYTKDVATLDLTTLVARGLRQDLVDLLSRSPAAYLPGSVQDAAWHDLYPQMIYSQADAEQLRVAGRRLPPHDAVNANCVCLACGAIFSERIGCPLHSFAYLWRGSYLQVIGPSGEVQYYPVRDREILLGRAGYPGPCIQLSNDDATSQAHVQLVFSHDGRIQVKDLNSDNGTWLCFDVLVLPADLSLQNNVTLRVGDHRVILRTTERRACDTALPQEFVVVRRGK